MKATHTLRGKSNPFRSGPALLRSARADGWFPLMRDMTRRELERMYREAAERASTFEDPAPQWLQEIWVERLRLAEGRVVLEMVKEGFKDAHAEFTGKSYAPETVSVLNIYNQAFRAKGITPDDESWIQAVTVQEGIDSIEAEFLTVADFGKVEAHLNRVATGQTRRVASAIQGIFARAQAVETDPRKIAKSILAQGAARSRSQAAMIARTETIWSYNEGAQQRYKSSGVTVKEWVVTRDDLLCPFCRAMDGRTMSVEGDYWPEGSTMQVQDGDRTRSLSFKAGVDHPPLHPHCRCTLVPVLLPTTVQLGVPVTTRISEEKEVRPRRKKKKKKVVEPEVAELLPAKQLRKDFAAALQTEKIDVRPLLKERRLLDTDIKKVKKELQRSGVFTRGQYNQLERQVRDQTKKVKALDLRIAREEQRAGKVLFDSIRPQRGESTKIGVRVKGPQAKQVNRFARNLGDVLDQRTSNQMIGAPSMNVRGVSSGRSSYSSIERRISLDRSDGERTFWHEAGHWLEEETPEVGRAARKFFNKRTKREKLRQLSAVTDIDYDRSEKTKKDKFFDPYVGKVYPGQEGTEITSMGLEALFSQPQEFMMQDPEHFDLIVNALRGTL